MQWLSAGQLANRLQRSMRLWVLLHWFYSWESPARESLPQPFVYTDLRDRLFAPTHPRSDQLSVEELLSHCHDPACVCHKSLQDWLMNENQDIQQWSEKVTQMTGLNTAELTAQLQQRPFATVHRSLRDDLKQLKKLGWLQSFKSGRYRFCASQDWPTPPVTIDHGLNFSQLSSAQTWELLKVLESVSFIQPNLDIAVNALWEQVIDYRPSSGKLGTEPQQRIFVHLDYILSDETQDRVDTYQEQLESLWHQHEGGVIQFKSWVAAQEREVQITTYPVCLHYARRAKYLTAYGIDPDGQFGWHNYRLDRITSKRFKVLAWGDPEIPQQLKADWRSGRLPLPEQVRSQLDAAWGFNFYLPSALLIIRFPARFARWYVNDTVRHPTFQPVSYKSLPQLICQEIQSQEEQEKLLQIIKQRSPKDTYYKAWIRLGDINVLMRLRDWRPNGEVIAPLSVRQTLKEEALQELSNYQES